MGKRPQRANTPRRHQPSRGVACCAARRSRRHRIGHLRPRHHLTPRRNRFRQRPVQVRTRLSAGGGSHERTRLWSPNSLLAGKIQGISSIRSSVARQRGPKRPSTQCLTSQFPTHPNREFFEALQGIKSGDQGNFFPHQGIRSRPLFGICFADKMRSSRQTSSLPRRRRGRRQTLEAAEADLALESGSCPCERRDRQFRKFGRQVRRRKQTAFLHSRTAVRSQPSAATGAINLPGRKVRRVRAVCLPASEGVGPRVRIRLAPAVSQANFVRRARKIRGSRAAVLEVRIHLPPAESPCKPDALD